MLDDSEGLPKKVQTFFKNNFGIEMTIEEAGKALLWIILSLACCCCCCGCCCGGIYIYNKKKSSNIVVQDGVTNVSEIKRYSELPNDDNLVTPRQNFKTDADQTDNQELLDMIEKLKLENRETDPEKQEKWNTILDKLKRANSTLDTPL
jgi:hypothetical protein